MKRHPAYDPPEYVAWAPDAEVMAEYRATIRKRPRRARFVEALEPAALLALYEGLLRFRLHDITLKRWVRQGVLSKAWLGTGEEAVTVGATHALRPGDLVGPMIRNAGACHERGIPVAQMLKAYLGTGDQITRGRDLHTGDPAVGVIPPTSQMGSFVPVFAGIGLALKARGGGGVGLTWIGDGASRTGVFHEGLNLAAVLRVPVVFIVQNNQVALGTALKKHSRGDLESLAAAYGVHGDTCEGNNVLDVLAAVADLAARCRRGRGPAVLVARTFRMGGHATHDEAEARALFSEEQFRYWGLRDPIGTYETYLVEDAADLQGRGRRGAARRAANARALEEAETRVTAEIDAAEREALDSRARRMPAPEDAAGGVYAPDSSAEPAARSGSVRRVS